MSTATTGATTQDARRTDTRARALETSAILFAERGYAGTSIRDITDKLGITKAALYYHFASKEDILRAIIEEPVSKMREVLGEERDLSTPGGRRDFALALLRAMASCQPASVAVFKDPELTAVVDRQVSLSGITNQIAILLAQGMSGTTDPAGVNPTYLVRAVGAVSAAEAMLHAWHQVHPDADQLSDDALVEVADTVSRALEG